MRRNPPENPSSQLWINFVPWKTAVLALGNIFLEVIKDSVMLSMPYFQGAAPRIALGKKKYCEIFPCIIRNMHRDWLISVKSTKQTKYDQHFTAPIALVLTFLELCDPLQEGIESSLCALAVGRCLVVELALLLLQLSHLPEELSLQGPQTLAQQLPQLQWKGGQCWDTSGWHICTWETQTLLLIDR